MLKRNAEMCLRAGILCFCLLALATFTQGSLQETKDEVVKVVEDKLHSVEKTTKGLEDKLTKLHEKSKSASSGGHEVKLTSSEKDFIAEMVKSVNGFQKEMSSSGMSEKLLKSRLETLIEQSKAEKQSATDSASPTCPPPGFNAVLPFSPEAYIARTPSTPSAVSI
jgi:hypothetical protein